MMWRSTAPWGRCPSGRRHRRLRGCARHVGGGRIPAIGSRAGGDGEARGPVLTDPDPRLSGRFNALLPGVHEWTPTQIRANVAYADVIGLALRVSAHAMAPGDTVSRLRVR